MDLKPILDKMNTLLPPEPAIRLSVESGEAGLFDSKLGGTPYFPKNMEYPLGKAKFFKGQPLILLAQLNFEKLPHIPDFPTKGILQFFIAADDLYGMTADYGEGFTRQDNFRVIYHENIITDESQLLSSDEIPKYSGDERYLPFEGEFLLKAEEPVMMNATMWDYRFGDAFVSAYNEFADEPLEDFWDLDDDIADELYAMTDFPDAIIGGYPIFTQDDPRVREEIADCDTLLFELDSVYKADRGIDIMWGDSGTGTFLIPRDRLKALDFSRVLYNYDCS